MTEMRGFQGCPLRKKHILGIILGLTVSLSALVSSQLLAATEPPRPLSDYVVRTLTTDDGLPMNQLNYLTAAQDGFLWIASFEGLVRYDGDSFKVISHRDYQNMKGGAFDIAVDSQNNIWAFDTNYRLLYCYSDGEIRSWDTSEHTKVVDYTLFKNSEGNVIFLGKGGFHQIVNDRIQPYPVSGIKDLEIYDAFFLADGSLWAADLRGGVYKINPDGSRTRHDLTLYGATSGRVSRITQGPDDQVWAITVDNELASFSNGEWSIHFDEELALSGQTRGILSEDNGALWLGTEAGIYRFYAGRFEKLREITQHSPDHVFSITKAADGTIAYSTFNHGLKLIYPGSFETYSPRNGLKVGAIRCIVDHPVEGKLVGSTIGVDHVKNGFATPVFPEIDGLDVTDIVPVSESEFFFSTYGQGLYHLKNRELTRYRKEDGLASDTIYRIYMDKQGLLWLTSYGGVNTFDGNSFSTISLGDDIEAPVVISQFTDSQEAKWFSIASGGIRKLLNGKVSRPLDGSGLERATVFHLCEDHDGVLWGGYSGGVLRIDGDKVSAFGMEGILPSLNIFHAVNDNRGSLWLTTNRGVYQMNISDFEGESWPRTLQYKHYLDHDGLPGNNVTALSRNLKENNRVWIPMSEGVAVLDYGNFQPHQYLPSIYINEVRRDNILVTEIPFKQSSDNQFEAGLKQLRISYTAPRYQANNRIEFRTRLAGFDDWASTYRREAIYTNLPPDKYTFEVEVFDPKQPNAVSKRASYSFSIRPHFYQTIYFYAIVVISLLLVGYLINYARMRAIRVQQQKLELLVDQRTTELSQQSKELLFAKEQAEAANKAKSAFIANISHEIRTPMNSILGFTGILSDEVKNPDLEAYLEIIKTSGKTLLILINDLLDISKIEANKLAIEPKPTNISKLCKQTLTLFEPALAEKKISITYHESENVPTFLMIDQARLRQVLINLIGNAIKFTDKGAIRLELHAGYKFYGKIPITCKIIDSGIGIPEEKLETIFEAFEQAHSSERTKEVGTGLGLSIVKRLTELMGGTIEVESKENEGTQFTIYFPEVPIAEAPSEPQDEEFSPDSNILHRLPKQMSQIDSAHLSDLLSDPNAGAEIRTELATILIDKLIPSLKTMDTTRIALATEQILEINKALKSSILEQLVREIEVCIDEISVDKSRQIRAHLLAATAEREDTPSA